MPRLQVIERMNDMEQDYKNIELEATVDGAYSYGSLDINEPARDDAGSPQGTAWATFSTGLQTQSGL